MIILFAFGITGFFAIMEFITNRNIFNCSCCKRRELILEMDLESNENHLEELIPDEYLENVCPVCIEDFTEENPPYKIKFCDNDKHPFHKDCIMETFEKISVFCPVCRSNG